MEDKKPEATLPSTHTPEGASNDEVNRHLDKLIVDRERVGRFELLASLATEEVRGDPPVNFEEMARF